jgi:hypothetical protein
VRKQWANVLSLLRAKSPTGSNSHTLPIPVFMRVLLDAQGKKYSSVNVLHNLPALSFTLNCMF